MAITKMGTYRNPPEDITDYEAIVEKLDSYARTIGGQGMILTEWTNANEWPKLAMGSYIFHGGASYIVDTEDYTIGEPSDGTYYLRIVASGETLAVSWISSLIGYAWNPIYNGLYHSDQSQILPYQMIVTGAVIEKWKISNLAQGGGFIRSNWQGAVRMDSINTGQGDFKIGQNLRPTDNVEFAKGLFTLLDTGHGENELYPMNQAVRRSDNVEFNEVKQAVALILSRKWDESITYDREIINAKAGSVIAYSSDSQSSTSSGAYAKVKEITVNITGTITVEFGLRANSSQNPAYGRIYKNGSAIGTERTSDESLSTFSQNISVTKGDKVQIYAKSGNIAYVSNFRIQTLRGFIV